MADILYFCACIVPSIRLNYCFDNENHYHFTVIEEEKVNNLVHFINFSYFKAVFYIAFFGFRSIILSLGYFSEL
tara:strand:- start:1834 stop:2055 length:222 start_codon:yes stop_codon:yes gene_type:complete